MNRFVYECVAMALRDLLYETRRSAKHKSISALSERSCRTFADDQLLPKIAASSKTQHYNTGFHCVLRCCKVVTFEPERRRQLLKLQRLSIWTIVCYKKNKSILCNSPTMRTVLFVRIFYDVCEKKYRRISYLRWICPAKVLDKSDDQNILLKL